MTAPSVRTTTPAAQDDRLLGEWPGPGENRHTLHHNAGEDFTYLLRWRDPDDSPPATVVATVEHTGAAVSRVDWDPDLAETAAWRVGVEAWIASLIDQEWTS